MALESQTPLVIGIVGGIASGKSLVSQFFHEQGAVILDADRAGHLALNEPQVVEEICGRWGPSILHGDGSVNRSAVAKIVFGDSPQNRIELEFLEKLTHPRIGERLRRQIQSLRENGTPAAILDAAVMFKAGWDQFCDYILFVDAPRSQRLARAKGRGWTEDEFDSRESSQEPLDRKRNCADYIIDNSAAPENTRRQVEALWRQIINPKHQAQQGDSG